MVPQPRKWMQGLQTTGIYTKHKHKWYLWNDLIKLNWYISIQLIPLVPDLKGQSIIACGFVCRQIRPKMTLCRGGCNISNLAGISQQYLEWDRLNCEINSYLQDKNEWMNKWRFMISIFRNLQYNVCYNIDGNRILDFLSQTRAHIVRCYFD